MKKPKYVNEFVDRHGRVRCYFRRKGYPRIPLPGVMWSTEFMDAYAAAMKGEVPPPVAPRETDQGEPAKFCPHCGSSLLAKIPTVRTGVTVRGKARPRARHTPANDNRPPAAL